MEILTRNSRNGGFFFCVGAEIFDAESSSCDINKDAVAVKAVVLSLMRLSESS